MVKIPPVVKPRLRNQSLECHNAPPTCWRWTSRWTPQRHDSFHSYSAVAVAISPSDPWLLLPALPSKKKKHMLLLHRNGAQAVDSRRAAVSAKQKKPVPTAPPRNPNNFTSHMWCAAWEPSSFKRTWKINMPLTEACGMPFATHRFHGVATNYTTCPPTLKPW